VPTAAQAPIIADVLGSTFIGFDFEIDCMKPAAKLALKFGLNFPLSVPSTLLVHYYLQINTDRLQQPIIMAVLPNPNPPQTQPPLVCFAMKDY